MGTTAAVVQPGRAEHGGAAAYAVPAGAWDPLKQIPPLRAEPSGKEGTDRLDGERIQRFGYEFASQTEALLIRDRQIEYNIRMLCGQQRNVWHPTLGRFFDTVDWLSNDERAYRKLPVINKLLRWFVVTLSRLTENPPILTMLPGPDRVDAMLAEVLDTLVKKDWRDAGMAAVHVEVMTWLLVAGRGHAISRIDPTRGEWQPWIATAPVPIIQPDPQSPHGFSPAMDPATQQPAMSPPQPNIPLAPDGSPNAVMHVNGAIQRGAPHMERMGGVAVDAYSPLQVRGQWGPQLWHDKRWHTVQRFLTPEEVFEATGCEVEPDLSEQAAANVATLERILWGSGFYGETLGRVGAGWVDSRVKGPLCTLYQRWQKPLPFDETLLGTWAEPMMETPDTPGGRETMWTPKSVCYDGPRRVKWPHVSPVRCFDFIRLPGRPTGLSSIETLLSPQRAYNDARGQVAEQAGLLGNPQVILDSDFGLQVDQITNEPGKVYAGTRRPGIPAVEYLAAPPVSPDVINQIKFSAEEIDELGGLKGTEGAPPTEDPSGALVQELRFNADRLLGTPARQNVEEYARMGDDWRALYKIIYTAPTIIAITGQDNLAETITVLPMVFQEGHVSIVPDMESMLPEGRGERQQRATFLWQSGAFGDPASPQAIEVYLEQSRFPNYSRLARPGGVDRVTAEQENGKILSGAFAQPVLDWYDHAVHLTVHERYMKSPEFLKQPPIVQQAFAFHRLQHILKLQQQLAAMGPPPMLPGAPPGGGPPHPHPPPRRAMGRGGRPLRPGAKGGSKGGPPGHRSPPPVRSADQPPSALSHPQT